ncbi:MAG: hypothetical protein ABI855_10365, partial [Bacteroidota bacterium]
MPDSASVKNIFSKNQRFKEALIITFIFFVLELILISFHEMWRDEIATWSLCFNSHSLKELLFITRYEGHPKLWFIIVYFVQLFTGNIFYMQLVHICIAAATVFVFCFYSPFSLGKNILFCFGYFFVYEYAVLSRNYAIEIFLLFLAVSAYTKSNGKSIILVSAILFFLLQTSLYAVIIGMVFYCYMILSEFLLRITITKKMILSSFIILCGLIFSVLAMIPPPDGGMHYGWNLKFVPGFLVQVSASVFNSYFPLPRFKNNFWNSNFLDVFSNGIWLQFFLTLIILVIVTVIFYDNKKVLFLFYSGT